MHATTRICGPKPTIAIWPMCSPSKARSPRQSPISCRPSCRQKRKWTSRSGRRKTLPPTISTCEQKNSSTPPNLTPLAGEKIILKRCSLLDQAIARDPAFLLAHCQLAYMHDQIYLYNFDHTETRLALAETSVKAAVRLEPDSG